NPNSPPYLVNKFSHNRPEPADQVIIVVESRGMNALNKKIVEPLDTIPRNIGSITIDNQKYGRYMGEVQIIKTDLPMDEKVNVCGHLDQASINRKSTRLNSSHVSISYAVFCLKKKKNRKMERLRRDLKISS